MGPAWGPKVDLGAHFEGKRGSGLFLGCPGDVILRPRVAQETPRVANSHQKSAQRGPREVPKERKNTKSRKLRHLDFERPYGGLATFTPFGGTGTGKKAAEIRTLRKILETCCFWPCPPPPKANPPPKGGGATGGGAGGGGGQRTITPSYTPLVPPPAPSPAEPPRRPPRAELKLKLKLLYLYSTLS